jgi:hypothetical protein
MEFPSNIEELQMYFLKEIKWTCSCYSVKDWTYLILGSSTESAYYGS